ncbi:purine-nucleoside phosphorylase [Candidatus Sulfidibacterium hydrothermale]|uniref:purine-nucleoside phosphorylase n=1 Tax=Candidatus Sulfidibacterium hydrothermale TaxID=2875962 RepID=UPI001F0A2FF1|nr:purine-nucleoside phosphorylase [Candidatus Sulfidibacterium hydrothermale]UBM61741.1 purine-nucleoside phosphorylase [Candidatus Sulfidibacterium hydrothermale]
MIKKIKESAEFLQREGMVAPEVGIILGTGLGSLVQNVKVEKTIDYERIPHFPVSTVEFHTGKLIYGELGGKKVLVMNGRFHFYEGYSLQEITFPVRVMKMLGIHTLLVSNAAGAVNLDLKKASLMIIDDHINMLPGNPLVGRNLDELGPRFPDMSRPYDPELITHMEKIAADKKIPLQKGVYVAWIGPSLETRAEYRFIKTMGADVVGMSTVPEVIVANHMGMRVAAVSVITDTCDPDNLVPIDIDDVLNNARIAEKDLVFLFGQLIQEM